MLDVFFKDKQHYNTPLDPTKAYIEQLTFFIQTKKNVSYEKAKAVAHTIFRKHFRDRPVKCFERIENGDKVVKDTTLHRYTYDNLKQENILAPTFTSYMPRKHRKSILSEFIFVSVAKRSKAKKEAQRAKAAGDLLLADNKNNEQNTLKTYNNSMSGSFAQEACILHNPPNHSTLTSLTRTMTSLSNANNERIVAGNRYYPRPIDVLNNLVYICTYTDTAAIEAAIKTFHLHIPTVAEVTSVLKYSSDLYFFDKRYYEEKIIPFLEQLSPVHLAAICYTGDLYHLRKFNPDFIRNVLDELTVRSPITEERDPDLINKIYKVDENILNFVHHIYFEELKGKGKDYAQMLNTGIPDAIYKTSMHVMEVLLRYKTFFSTFFMTPIMPNNAFRLKNMRRRTVVLSDTDSTCFTLDEWIRWYGHGEYAVNNKTIAVGGAIAYITTQVIINLLRNLSRNLNVDEELIDKLGMKNEYLWLAHVPAEVSKHYYAYTVLQEGTVLTEEEFEIKGVHLKNSAVPTFVIDDGKAMMKSILQKTGSNQKLNFGELADRVIRLERVIHDSVLKGEPVFLKRSKIKNAEAYAEGPERSPYGRHVFWNKVFGPRYGEFPEPPYDVIKIPTTVTTKTALQHWLSSIDDTELRARLELWLKENNKTSLPTIYLNDVHVTGNGIPKEILSIIDVNRIILDVTIQHRVILETLGVMLYKEKLVSEQFSH